MPTLRDLRDDAFMTQGDLAKACGVSQASVSDWEHGYTMPSVKNRRKLVEVLGKTQKEIMEAIRETRRKEKERPAA